MEKETCRCPVPQTAGSLTCIRCGLYPPTPHREEHTEWEKKFNELFVREDDGLLIIDKYDGDTLKIFIHSILKDQRERIRREITSLPMMNNETPEKRATTYWLNTEHVLNLPSLQD